MQRRVGMRCRTGLAQTEQLKGGARSSQRKPLNRCVWGASCHSSRSPVANPICRWQRAIAPLVAATLIGTVLSSAAFIRAAASSLARHPLDSAPLNSDPFHPDFAPVSPILHQPGATTGVSIGQGDAMTSATVSGGDRPTVLSLLDWLIAPASVLQELSPLVTTLFPQSPWHYPEQWAPDFPSFDSSRLDAQIRLYGAYLAEFGVPDVLIVGSSRSLQGIDPAILQDTLAKAGRADLKVYNFSINGATAQVVDFIVREVFTPEQLPPLIIWGDGSRAFNSLRPDRTFEHIQASPGYARLQAGDYPIRYPFDRPFINRVCSNDGFRHPHHGIGSPVPAPPRQSRSMERQPAEPGMSGCDRRREIWQDLGISPEHENTITTLKEEWVDKYGDGLTALGFSVVSDTFDPVQYYQTYPRVPGAYDTNYTEFQLSGVQTQAVYRLVNYLNRQQVPIVFVNLPLTADYLDAFRQEREEWFVQYLHQLAQQPEFLLRDLNQPAFSQNQFFQDPSHLNQAGAEAIARHLANDPTLPWPDER